MADRNGVLMRVATAALVLGVAGCVSKPKIQEVKEAVFFPPPPVEPRVQYLMDIHGASDFAQRKSRFFEFIVGRPSEAYPTVMKPFGIALLDGKVYVADTVAPRIVVFDMKKRTMEWFGRSGRGVLKKPINVRVGPDRLIYVGDTLRNQVIVFTPEGKYVTEYGNGKEFNPSDVLPTVDELYVLDNVTHDVKVYDLKTHALKRTLGRRGYTPGEFNFPINMARAPDGDLVIVDSMNFRVQKIDSNTGTSALMFGQIGSKPGAFARPKGIAVDRNGIMYVVDAQSGVVQMFNGEGKLLMHLGGHHIGRGQLILPAQVCVDYDNLEFFRQYIDPNFDAEHLILVSNQLEENKITVYAFGRLRNVIPALQPVAAPGNTAAKSGVTTSGDKGRDKELPQPPELQDPAAKK